MKFIISIFGCYFIEIVNILCYKKKKNITTRVIYNNIKTEGNIELNDLNFQLQNQYLLRSQKIYTS